MQTPAPRECSRLRISNARADWWLDKQKVKERLGGALMVSVGEVKQVVGLYQPRPTRDGGDDRAVHEPVQLKVGISAEPNARHRLVALEEALDTSKWELFPNFLGARIRAGPDHAVVHELLVEGDVAAGNFTHLEATITMGGQPSLPRKRFDIHNFLIHWLPGADETVDTDSEEGDVPDPEGEVEVEAYPMVLAALRAAGEIPFAETVIKRGALVPFALAALGRAGRGQARGAHAAIFGWLDALESKLRTSASPAVRRLKRFRATGVAGDSAAERGKCVRRLYLDGAVQRHVARAEEIDVDGEGDSPPRAAQEADRRPPRRRSRPARVPRGSGRDRDDSDSESTPASSDSDEPDDSDSSEPEQPQRSSKRQRRAASSVGGSSTATVSAAAASAAELKAITPKGVHGISAARIFFAEAQLREAADWVGSAEVPRAVPEDEGEAQRLLTRYGLALARLEAKIGQQWRSQKRPADLNVVAVWAEQALHMLAHGKRSPGGAEVRVDRADPLSDFSGGKKGKKPLEAKTRDEAVASVVVQRLHAAGKDVDRTVNAYSEVALGIASQPEAVRRDLQRVAMSNQCVDATGATDLTHTTLPAVAALVANRVVDEIRGFLLHQARVDITQSAVMPADTARDLAAAAALGRYRIADFIKAARALRQPRPPAVGTVEEVQLGFALMRKTWRCAHEKLGLPSGDLETFAEAVETTGSGFQLSAGDLLAYVRGVVDSYSEQARQFRLHDGQPPSLAVAIEERRAGYEVKAARSVLLAEAQSLASKRKREGTRERQVERTSGGGAEGRGASAAQRKQRRSVARSSDSSSRSASPERKPPKAKPSGIGAKPVSAFPDMKRPAKERVDRATAEARAKYEKHCVSFLLYSCTRRECKFKHAVPADFKAFARKHGYESIGAAAKGVTLE